MVRSKGVDLTSTVVLLVVAIAVSRWYLAQPSWLRALLIVSVGVTVFGCWWLFWRRTTCGVANRSNPRGCSNTVRGALSACWIADHKVRKRRLLWARLLRRAPRRPTAADPSWSVARSEPPAWSAKPSHDTGDEWLPGFAYHMIMLVATVLSTVIAFITMVQEF